MKQKSLMLCAVFALALIPATSQAAGDPAKGKEKATPCAGCHGPAGKSVNPLWPNLAGQHADYLAKALRDYRDGKRSDPLMGPMASVLSDEDIENLAAWFASLKP